MTFSSKGKIRTLWCKPGKRYALTCTRYILSEFFSRLQIFVINRVFHLPPKKKTRQISRIRRTNYTKARMLTIIQCNDTIIEIISLEIEHIMFYLKRNTRQKKNKKKKLVSFYVSRDWMWHISDLLWPRRLGRSYKEYWIITKSFRMSRYFAAVMVYCWKSFLGMFLGGVTENP